MRRRGYGIQIDPKRRIWISVVRVIEILHPISHCIDEDGTIECHRVRNLSVSVFDSSGPYLPSRSLACIGSDGARFISGLRWCGNEFKSPRV